MGCATSTTQSARSHKVCAIDYEYDICTPTGSIVDRVSARKIRNLRMDSWKDMLMDCEIDAVGQVLTGMALFCRDFNQANDRLGENKLYINRCRVTPMANSSDLLSLLTIMRRLMAVQTDSPHEMDTIRALGRKHALVGRQDRLGPLLEVLMSTITKRLYANGSYEVLMAWRYHFDILRRAMTRDHITLYPALHSQRVSSSHSKNESSFTEIASTDEVSQGLQVSVFEEKDDHDYYLHVDTDTHNHGRNKMRKSLSNSNTDSNCDATMFGSGKTMMSPEAEAQLTKAVFELDSNVAERNQNHLPLPNFILMQINIEVEDDSSLKLTSLSYEPIPVF